LPPDLSSGAARSPLRTFVRSLQFLPRAGVRRESATARRSRGGPVRAKDAFRLGHSLRRCARAGRFTPGGRGLRKRQTRAAKLGSAGGSSPDIGARLTNTLSADARRSLPRIDAFSTTDDAFDGSDAETPVSGPAIRGESSRRRNDQSVAGARPGARPLAMLFVMLRRGSTSGSCCDYARPDSARVAHSSRHWRTKAMREQHPCLDGGMQVPSARRHLQAR
jgi:hypothetical protein